MRYMPLTSRIQTRDQASKRRLYCTTSSVIAEGQRDALCQLTVEIL